jgi:hypothetical protein
MSAIVHGIMVASARGKRKRSSAMSFDLQKAW